LLRQDANGLITYRFENLPQEDVAHAVFTRLGGVSQGPFATLNVGNAVGDDEVAVAENHARVYAHLGLSSAHITSAHQVHSNRIAVVTASDAGQIMPSTDGLVTDTPGLALLLRFADCQPILLYDPAHHALGLIHAGWRGVAQGIARRAVETMRRAFGSRASELIAGLGPAIGPCCYTVDHHVAAAMGYVLPNWNQAMSLLEEDRWQLDLSAANAQQLTAEGVRQIEQAHLCTACHNDEFFSHRADKGQTGRFAVVAYLQTSSREQKKKETIAAQREQRPEEAITPDSLHPPGFPALGEFIGSDP
jgi:YfiH family protein